MDKEEEAATSMAEAPIHGDTLHSIFSHVPLIDLLPACYVSKSWNRAVFTSLRHFNKIKPWLVVHTQRTTPPHVTTTHAYDPRSRVWIQTTSSIDHVPSSACCCLRSSHSTLLYMLSPSKLSFSFDPLHMKWHHADAPRVWRVDPVVALVGHHVIVAGGACDFEDDPLAVEIYSLETRTWEVCQSMPTILKDSAAPTWLSVAVNSHKLYVAEKYSGVTYSFDPKTKSWSGPYDLRRDRNTFYSVITFVNDRLIVVGLINGVDIDNDDDDDDDHDVKSIKLWEVKGESLEEFEEMGEMPKVLLEKMMKGSGRSNSIEVTSMGGYVYMNNPSNWEELVMCEIGEGDGTGDGGEYCKWSGIKNVVGSEDDEIKIMNRVVLTCTSMDMGGLHRAVVHENCRFLVKES